VTVDQDSETQKTNVQCTRLKKNDEIEATDETFLKVRRLDLLIEVADLPFVPDESKNFKLTFPDGSIWRAFAETGIPAVDFQGIDQLTYVIHCKKVPE